MSDDEDIRSMIDTRSHMKSCSSHVQEIRIEVSSPPGNFQLQRTPSGGASPIIHASKSSSKKVYQDDFTPDGVKTAQDPCWNWTRSCVGSIVVRPSVKMGDEVKPHFSLVMQSYADDRLRSAHESI
jgi:hypothetical protein